MILNDKDPGKHGFSNTKVVVCGGDYLPNETRIKAEKYFIWNNLKFLKILTCGNILLIYPLFFLAFPS